MNAQARWLKVGAMLAALVALYAVAPKPAVMVALVALIIAAGYVLNKQKAGA